jgi:hypothetical protein
MLKIENVRGVLLMTQDDNDPDRELSENESEHNAESTVQSNIEEDDLGNMQEVLDLDQVCHDRTIHTTRVPPAKKLNGANTDIARTSLPNLGHPAVAMAPPVLKHRKSAINISREPVIIQALPLPNAGGD